MKRLKIKLNTHFLSKTIFVIFLQAKARKKAVAQPELIPITSTRRGRKYLVLH